MSTDETPQPSPSNPDNSNRWAKARRTFTLLYALAMVASAAGLIVVWYGWDPVWGPAVQNLITYSLILLACLMTAGWLIVFSPFRWKTVLMILGIAACVVTGAAACVRTFEFDGDMGIVAHYRWEPTAEERLAAHREAASSLDIELDEELSAPEVAPTDSPGYRGHDTTGIIESPPLSQDWQTSPPRQLWKQPCGGGYSAFSVVGNSVVTLEQRGDQEAVVCYDKTTGRERWIHEYAASFYEAVGGPGPRATPTIIDGEVFSYGAEGDLVCLDLLTGQLKWHTDALPDELKNVTWGLSSSPLVIENLVFVEAGGDDGDGLIAYERSTGEIAWKRPGVETIPPVDDQDRENRAGYGSPMLVTLHGVRQVLIFDGEGLRSHVPETGEELWFHEFRNSPGVNVAQPIIFDDGRVFLSQSYGVGCRMIQVGHESDTWSTETLWENLNMKCKFTSPVLYEGFLYGLDEGILVCLNSETGKREWKKGRFGHGQVLLANGQLVIISERGDVVLVEPTQERFNEITRFSALQQPKVWNPHALANGIVYVRNHEEMAAYDLRAQTD